MALIDKTGKKFFLLFLIFLLVLLLVATFGQRGLIHLYRLKKELNSIEAFNQRVKEENRKLETQINLLKNNKDYGEKIARQELGLVKEDEVVYYFEK